MKGRTTRRDFLNGSRIAIGASLLSPWAEAFGRSDLPFELDADYYPPRKTGMRGSHSGSWETMHARVGGKQWQPGQIEESYDLVVVGGGISGLASAFFYQQENPDARVL
ncbi:MAG: NAD(P)/FAD-dependent oxidoreductase, partial [Pseudomonadota bacterium]